MLWVGIKKKRFRWVVSISDTNVSYLPKCQHSFKIPPKCDNQ